MTYCVDNVSVAKLTNEQKEYHYNHLVNNLGCNELLAATIVTCINRCYQGDKYKVGTSINNYIMDFIWWRMDKHFNTDSPDFPNFPKVENDFWCYMRESVSVDKQQYNQRESIMKILCSKSGIEFRCDHIPLYLTSGEVHHPIFNLPLPKLFRLYPKWQGKELTKTDSFLLFTALLNATELVEFRCHIYQRPNTDQIVASNMTALFQTIGNITTIKNPRFAVPRFVISKETRDLENVRYWIEAW